MDELLGERIREIRNAQNITQETMADQLDISRQKYARIERGQCSITYEMLTRISQLLSITVKDITDVLEPKQNVTFRSDGIGGKTENVFEMIDLFYANKHLYTKLRNREA